MWMGLFVKMITSELAKALIGLLVKKLVDHKEDGVTKDVAEAMLDGIAKSRANNAPTSAIDTIKGVL